jgi:hypothetical protein
MIMPWKKRLKTTPNDVRRAWLLAAPFVLLGASKAEADTAFTNFAFARATGTGRVNRTMPERLDDICNVKDFGAKGNNSHDDAAAIQAAFNSGAGTIFFPTGRYRIGVPILIPGDNLARIIVGCGIAGDSSSLGGSKIIGNFRDYLLKAPQGDFSPIGAVSNMGFRNDYDATGQAPITSADPPGVTNPGNGMGCCYVGGSNMRWTNIHLQTGGGIGLYFPGINNYLSSFNANANFDGPATRPFSCCIWGSACNIGDGKPFGARYGIVIVQGPATVSNMDIERCQYGLGVSGAPLTFWDRNTNSVVGPWTDNPNYVNGHGLNFESCGSASQGGAAMVVNCFAGADFSNVTSASFGQIGPADYGIWIQGGKNLIFRNVRVSDRADVAGIGLSYNGSHQNYSFYNCAADTFSATGGKQWDLIPTRPSDSVVMSAVENGAPGHRLHNCNFDGARPFALLPAPPATIWGVDEQICSDSQIPVWETTTDGTHPAPYSNVGRALSGGGGPYKVKVRWQPTGINIAAAASFPHGDGNAQSIPMSIANPGTIFPGMGAFNITTNAVIGKVQSYTGATLVIAPNGNLGPPSSTSSDLITFAGWFIMG